MSASKDLSPAKKKADAEKRIAVPVSDQIRDNLRSSLRVPMFNWIWRSCNRNEKRWELWDNALAYKYMWHANNGEFFAYDPDLIMDSFGSGISNLGQWINFIAENRKDPHWNHKLMLVTRAYEQYTKAAPYE